MPPEDCPALWTLGAFRNGALEVLDNLRPIDVRHYLASNYTRSGLKAALKDGTVVVLRSGIHIAVEIREHTRLRQDDILLMTG
jgi:hypothetical protein